MALFNTSTIVLKKLNPSSLQRCIHSTAVLNKCRSGRYRPTLRRNRPLTYEMAYKPSDIASKKSWNSWNTSNLEGGIRKMDCAIEDMFIRKFMEGTWHRIFLSEIIIKRNHNMVRVSGIIHRNYDPKKMYFLAGYSEELLSTYLHCPVKLEIVSTEKKEDIVYKYI